MTINSIHSIVELSERNLHLMVTNEELQKNVSLFAKSTVKRGWHGVVKDVAGLLIGTGGNIYILMNTRQLLDQTTVFMFGGKATKLTVYNINCTTQPAQSLDLNVCENVWLHIKRALQPITGNFSTQKELIAEIRRVWESLSINYIQGLYQTIPTWIRLVIRMKGHLTKY